MAVQSGERFANEAHVAASRARDVARDPYEEAIAESLMKLSTAVADLHRQVSSLR